PGGCCGTSWKNSALSIVPATARSGARSKKHSSAPSPPPLGHPAEGQQRVRSRYGRRAGRLHAATRRRLSAGLPRRDLEATHCRNARANPDESGTPGPFRLRVRAQWHRQSLHDVCSARRLAPRQPVEARRMVERFEWHYTPNHGSWLNLAESELGVLTSQCLNRRIPNKQILIDEIAAWEHDRNANHTKADWQFTTKNARIKLKHLYPAI